MPTGSLRQPRAWVNAGGGNINVLEASVELVRGEQGSMADAVMALDDPSNPGADFWADTAPISASIIGTNGGSGGATIFSGTVEEVEVDFTARVVRIHIVDKVPEFTGTRNDQKYPNMTNEQVAAAVAGNHSVGFQSDGSTDQAGRTFNNQEYAFNSNVENDWDVVQSAAAADGKVCYLDPINNILNYVDPSNQPSDGVYSVIYTPPTPESYETGSVIHLQCKRRVDIGEGVSGQVASWNTRDKEARNSQTGSPAQSGFSLDN